MQVRTISVRDLFSEGIGAREGVDVERASWKGDQLRPRRFGQARSPLRALACSLVLGVKTGGLLSTVSSLSSEGD